MTDFDWRLEAELKLWLGPVVAARPPRRKDRYEAARIFRPRLVVVEAAPEVIRAIEPVVAMVAMPVAPTSPV